MEEYIINGVKIDYDTFDLANMELFDSEVKRVKEDVEAAQREDWKKENYIQILREQCYSIMDFFDTVLGEGSAKKIFGNRVNVLEIISAYKKFTEDVTNTRSELGGLGVNAKNAVQIPHPTNREQRRAAERQMRRQEAAARAAAKASET